LISKRRGDTIKVTSRTKEKLLKRKVYCNSSVLSLLFSLSLLLISENIVFIPVQIANAQILPNTFTTNPFPNLAGFGLTSQFQTLSPWFPSVPAIACSGLFSLTITGKPHMNVHISNNGDNNKDLLSLQVISKPILYNLYGQLIIANVDGKIAQGKQNIEHNKVHDFDVKNIFNNCRTLAFSSSPNTHIATPVPTIKNGVVTNTGLLTSGATGGSNYPNSYPATPGVACIAGYQRSADGTLCVQTLYL
jgi:hypothetical protein